MADKIRITADFIEQLSYISENKWMRTREFREALFDFRKHGYNTDNPKTYDAKTALEVIERKKGYP